MGGSTVTKQQKTNLKPFQAIIQNQNNITLDLNLSIKARIIIYPYTLHKMRFSYHESLIFSGRVIYYVRVNRRIFFSMVITHFIEFHYPGNYCSSLITPRNFITYY